MFGAMSKVIAVCNRHAMLLTKTPQAVQKGLRNLCSIMTEQQSGNRMDKRILLDLRKHGTHIIHTAKSFVILKEQNVRPVAIDRKIPVGKQHRKIARIPANQHAACHTRHQ